MLIRSISGYIISCLYLLCFSQTAFAQDDEDSTSSRDIVVTQNRFSVAADFFQPILNSFSGTRKSYEFALDYSLPKDVYIAAELGFGKASVNYTAPDLNYATTNSFFRLGINKSMLSRMGANDWDMVFVGLRYAMAFINRSEATYSIENPYFGNNYGTVPATNLIAHWAEITGGMRVELFKSIFAGYNVRAKFMLNPKNFRELAPYSIAGFGKGEKTAVFDFNMYLGFAIKWDKKKPG